MGGAGKGPGIGWSRAQPKYSWEANLYATRGNPLVLRWQKLNGVTMENNNIANYVSIFECAIPFNCALFKCFKFTGSKLSLRKYIKCSRVEKSCYQLVSHYYFDWNLLWLWNYRTIKRNVILSNVKQQCGHLPPGSAVNLNKLNLIEQELFIKMLYRVWSSLQPDKKTNKSPRRMKVSPPARNDDRSPIWKIQEDLLYLFSSEDKYKEFSLYQREDWLIDWNQLQLCQF